MNDFLSLFGEYEPIVTLVDEINEVYQVSTNYGQVAYYLIVIIFFYSIFRLIGLLFSKK